MIIKTRVLTFKCFVFVAGIFEDGKFLVIFPICLEILNKAQVPSPRRLRFCNEFFCASECVESDGLICGNCDKKCEGLWV